MLIFFLCNAFARYDFFDSVKEKSLSIQKIKFNGHYLKRIRWVVLPVLVWKEHDCTFCDAFAYKVEMIWKYQYIFRQVNKAEIPLRQRATPSFSLEKDILLCQKSEIVR